MKLKKTPDLQQAGTAEASEWCSLGDRLARVNRGKFCELLGALRQVVRTQETGAREMPKRRRRRYLV